MIKYVCDKCKREFKSGGVTLSDGYSFDNVTTFLKEDKHLCRECACRFNAIKDRLKSLNDFFTMSNSEIALMKYDFKVGDTVITSTGQTGSIKSVCRCEECKKRGFYELKVKITNGIDDEIDVTINDRKSGFEKFYKIGKYQFGNIDRDTVEQRIQVETAKRFQIDTYIHHLCQQLDRLTQLSGGRFK